MILSSPREGTNPKYAKISNGFVMVIMSSTRLDKGGLSHEKRHRYDSYQDKHHEYTF